MSPQDQGLALASLLRGEVILFPTETVYGLGVDSKNAAAIERLYALKNRPHKKPFQQLISDVEMARANSMHWDQRAEKLSQTFWPGPLTLVISAKSGSMGWRIPRHKWLLELLKALARPLIATSANFSGHPPAKTFSEAIQAFGKKVGFAMDGGDLNMGEASTVVALEKEKIQILRQGAIPESDIFDALKG